MKSIMISINPKWVEKILNGEKTIELRKSAPKETPFKAYIYCTKGGRPLVFGQENIRSEEKYTLTSGYSLKEADKTFGVLNGKVVGEFVCREVEKFTVGIDYYEYIMGDDYFDATCLEDRDFLFEYGNSKPLYGMFITDLKIYDTPKELSDFKMPYKYDTEGYIICGESICPYYDSNGHWSVTCNKCKTLKEKYEIKRPFQSWGYCEGKK